MEAVAAAVSIILEYSIAPIARRISYPFKYKSNIENLKEEVEELTNARERNRRSIDSARRNGEAILRDVEDWQLKADETTEKMPGRIVEDEDRAKRRCFIGLCPNFIIRYHISKKAEKEAMAIADLRKKGVFDTVSYRAAPQGMECVSAKDYEALESRMEVFKEIMDVLTVGDVHMIGLYGMGGVGKTTLVREIGRQATEDKLFDIVIMAGVTQTVKISNIQGQIADMLGLKFDEESEKGRAGRLRERLKQEKKILIILDDLWETLDLDAVGIPFGIEHKGCKIVLTSRDLNVLSSGMDSQKNFAVGVLLEEEAWNFFKKMAGDNFDDPDLQSVAVEVAKECAGLPVAIVTVARALKNKILAEWRNALRELKRPSSRNFTGMHAVVYSTIEFSYNHLENQELKETFLLCSQMGYSATIADLLKYGIGLGLFHAAVTQEEAQDRVHSLVNRLRAACLLLDSGNSNEQLVMHDVVRDVAISVASRDHHVFTTTTEDELKEWPDKHVIESCTAIWLRCNISKLPEELHCPQLDLFHIESKDRLLEVPDKLFSGMHELKVLDLTNFSFPSLPSSLGLLKNLLTLCLHQSVLGDIGIIGELKKLEILSFAKSDIKHFPREIGQLTKLKVLDLSDCLDLEVIPPNIISKLSLLEELYMGNSFDQWKTEGVNNQGQNNASLAELKHLTLLSNLEIQIPNAHVLSKDLFSEKLQRYRICIGHVFGWKGKFKSLRRLQLKLNTSIHLAHGVQVLLRRAEDLYLRELKGVKNVLYELDEDGLPQLKHLHLHDSPEIQYIVNTMDRVPSHVFPMLESLILSNLVSLEKVYHGELGAESFKNLGIIEVKDCDALKNLFSFSVVQGLLQLRDIKVTSCQKMGNIVAEESEVDKNINEENSTIAFAQLQTLSLDDLPQLRSFCFVVNAQYSYESRSNKLATDCGSEENNLKDGMRTSMPLFDEKILFPNLKDLYLSSINSCELWHGQSPAISTSVQNLTSLHVSGCNRLKYLFSSSLVKSLRQLKYLNVHGCGLMEEIIVIEGLKEERMSKLFPELHSLFLFNLPKLTRFCPGDLIEFPSLKDLYIIGCSALKTFISSFASADITVGQEPCKEKHQNVTQPLFDEKVALPSLIVLYISLMDNLEKIWHSQLHTGSFSQLKKMSIRSCRKLVNILPPVLLGRFQRLEELTIGDCGSLEEIFELEELSWGETYPLVPFPLRDLSLHSLPKLKSMWTKDPQGILSFGNLHSVIVTDCGDLKNVFPSFIARDLLQLEKLKIQRSGVEEIIAKEENAAAVPRFVFPKLTSLSLGNLSKLRSLYPGTYTSEWPTLKNLKVHDCDNLKLFASEFLKFPERNREGQLDVQNHPLFLVKKVIPNLEALMLDGSNATTSSMWQCQFPAEFFSSLKRLQLCNFKDKLDDIPFGVLRLLTNVETLIIKSSSLKDLFLYEGHADKEENTATLARLRNLEIYSVDDKHIWEQNYGMVTLLQNLRTLNVKSCDSLVNLAQSSAPFQNLTSLAVRHCGGLSNLLTSSTANSLVQLVELSVEDCHKVTEVIVKPGDETEGEIIFSKLETLKLVELKNLISFCSGNYTFKFPYLKVVILEGCPKMRTFSSGVLSTPKLRGVKLNAYSEEDVWWEGDLNTTIRLLYTKMVGFDDIEDLKLSEFPELKEIWHGKLPVKFFHWLESLEVNECAFFIHAVPSNLLLGLKCLEKLSVRSCDSLEGVFNLEELSANLGAVGLLSNLEKLYLMDLPRLRHIWNKDPRGMLDFQNLSVLKIHNCSSLRNILAPSMALYLVQLREMDITNCAMMEEIITKGGAEDATTDKIIFPQLASIILDSLPSLINI